MLRFKPSFVNCTYFTPIVSPLLSSSYISKRRRRRRNNKQTISQCLSTWVGFIMCANIRSFWNVNFFLPFIVYLIPSTWFHCGRSQRNVVLSLNFDLWKYLHRDFHNFMHIWSENTSEKILLSPVRNLSVNLLHTVPQYTRKTICCGYLFYEGISLHCI